MGRPDGRRSAKMEDGGCFFCFVSSSLRAPVLSTRLSVTVCSSPSSLGLGAGQLTGFSPPATASGIWRWWQEHSAGAPQICRVSKHSVLRWRSVCLGASVVPKLPRARA